jgi:glycosyltransferase involved in cell wall biosynthesis
MIWLIHPAAGGPGLGRFWRPYHLATHWNSAGVENLVIAPQHHAWAIGPTPKAGLATIGDVNYYFVKMRSRGTRRFHRALAMFEFGLALRTDSALRRLGDKNPPQAIIYSSPAPYAFVTVAWLAKRYGAKLIFEVRDIWPDSLTEFTNLSANNPLVWLAARVERFAYHRADHVASLLPLAAQHMISRGMAPEKFLYVPNGVAKATNEVTGAEPDTPLIRQLKEFRANQYFVLIYAGNHGVVNNLEILLDVLGDIERGGHKKIACVFVGQGDRRRQLEDRARRMSLTNAVFLDQVDRTELVHAFRLADSGYQSLLPSALFRFGVSSNKLLDYLSAGLPVLYAVRAGNDPIRDSGAGLTVDPDDRGAIGQALLHLASMSIEERTAMGALGRRYVLENHDYAVLSDRYIALLSDAMCRRPAQDPYSRQLSKPCTY